MPKLEEAKEVLGGIEAERDAYEEMRDKARDEYLDKIQTDRDFYMEIAAVKRRIKRLEKEQHD